MFSLGGVHISGVFTMRDFTVIMKKQNISQYCFIITKVALGCKSSYPSFVLVNSHPSLELTLDICNPARGDTCAE